MRRFVRRKTLDQPPQLLSPSRPVNSVLGRRRPGLESADSAAAPPLEADPVTGTAEASSERGQSAARLSQRVAAVLSAAVAVLIPTGDKTNLLTRSTPNTGSSHPVPSATAITTTVATAEPVVSTAPESDGSCDTFSFHLPCPLPSEAPSVAAFSTSSSPGPASPLHLVRQCPASVVFGRKCVQVKALLVSRLASSPLLPGCGDLVVCRHFPRPPLLFRASSSPARVRDVLSHSASFNRIRLLSSLSLRLVFPCGS
ncbi:unnamed protein product [Protopolystoma xenopodis]|uniref:Uncharacterized protein n=1 Tax=Protopolystoma xenopodis TaxID=117903 RepID=A0A448X8A7_9PLAT|nr:unnamed protein product [Protopolystoma xenopodis]